MTSSAHFPQHHRLPAHASQNPAFRPGTDEQRALAALRCMCDSRTSEEIGAMLVERGLCREKNPHAHVRACMNPCKSEFFSPSEILAIETWTGIPAWTEFCAEAHGCELAVLDPAEALRRAEARMAALDAERCAEQARIQCLRARVNGPAEAPVWSPTRGAKFSLAGDA